MAPIMSYRFQIVIIKVNGGGGGGGGGGGYHPSPPSPSDVLATKRARLAVTDLPLSTDGRMSGLTD